MYRLLVQPELPGDPPLSKVIMPLNPDETGGRIGVVLEVEDSDIPTPHQATLDIQLAERMQDRKSGIPGGMWKPTSPPGLAERYQGLMDRVHGKISGPDRVIYFLHKSSNAVHEHLQENVFDDSRLFKIVGVGDFATQEPADPIDDGTYIGPHTAADAKVLAGGP